MENIMIGYLTMALCVGLILGAIIFSYLGERKIREKVRKWLTENPLSEKEEDELLSSL